MQNLASSDPKAPEEYESFRGFLLAELIRRIRNNPRYSLRAFARLLKTDPSFLSKLLSGKRPPTSRTVIAYSAVLGLSPSQMNHFLEPLLKKRVSSARTKLRSGNPQTLTLDEYQMISDGYHFAILELFRIPKMSVTSKSISKTLGITQIEAQDALERLERLKMIRVNEKKDFELSCGDHSVLSNLNTLAPLRKLHKQILSQAQNALDEIPFEFRDQSAVTIAIDPSLIPEARNKIKRFQQSLAAFLQRGNLTEIYQISISLFPLTNLKKKN